MTQQRHASETRVRFTEKKKAPMKKRMVAREDRTERLSASMLAQMVGPSAVMMSMVGVVVEHKSKGTTMVMPGLKAKLMVGKMVAMLPSLMETVGPTVITVAKLKEKPSHQQKLQVRVAETVGSARLTASTIFPRLRCRRGKQDPCSSRPARRRHPLRSTC